MKATWNETVIAQSDATVVVEGYVAFWKGVVVSD